MKKNTIVAAFASATAILLAASCQKQEEPELKKEGKTFTAVINQEITKTTITSAYKVNWDQGDLIDINGGTTYSATPDASDATKAGFTKVSGKDPEPDDYTAVYPSSLFKNSRYELPATQTYVKDKFNAPMCAYGSTETLEFKNMCGVLCFALKGTDKIKSIAVSTNKEKEEQLCGPFDFTTAPEFSFTGDNMGRTITLNCGEGVQLNSESSTNFYVYLPPSDYAAGMTISITNTDGNVFRKTTVTNITIARSKVYTFNWTPAFVPAYATQGVFSVGGDKKVCFSQGNLYCDISEGEPYTFMFEENQYDFYHDGDEETPEEHVSYFYWTDMAFQSPLSPEHEKEEGRFLFTNQHGNTPKTIPEKFVVNEEEGWRTLSKAEWYFLLNARPDDENKIVELSYTPFIESPAIISGEEYYGLFIYPDNYKGTKAAGEDESLDTWEEINNLGIVFLPLTEISGKDDLENGWMYWTSELYGDIEPYTASYVFLKTEDDGILYPRIGGKEVIDQMALPIRLVKDYREEE